MSRLIKSFTFLTGNLILYLLFFLFILCFISRINSLLRKLLFEYHLTLTLYLEIFPSTWLK